MNKEEFKKEAHKKINEISTKIDDLNAKKEEVQGSVKTKYEEILKDLKVKKIEMETRYEDLKNASEDKWEEVKTAFSSASDSFSEGLNKIKNLFK